MTDKPAGRATEPPQSCLESCCCPERVSLLAYLRTQLNNNPSELPAGEFKSQFNKEVEYEHIYDKLMLFLSKGGNSFFKKIP